MHILLALRWKMLLPFSLEVRFYFRYLNLTRLLWLTRIVLVTLNLTLTYTRCIIYHNDFVALNFICSHCDKQIRKPINTATTSNNN